MNANLSSPMGNWPEQGTYVPNKNGGKLIKEQKEFERIVWNAIGQLPQAEQVQAKQALASKQKPTKALLDLMKTVIERS